VAESAAAVALVATADSLALLPVASSAVKIELLLQRLHSEATARHFSTETRETAVLWMSMMVYRTRCTYRYRWWWLSYHDAAI